MLQLNQMQEPVEGGLQKVEFYEGNSVREIYCGLGVDDSVHHNYKAVHVHVLIRFLLPYHSHEQMVEMIRMKAR